MPFEVYEHTAFPRPLAERLRQRREQHVVDLRPVGARHFLQKEACLLSRQ